MYDLFLLVPYDVQNRQGMFGLPVVAFDHTYISPFVYVPYIPFLQALLLLKGRSLRDNCKLPHYIPKIVEKFNGIECVPNMKLILFDILMLLLINYFDLYIRTFIQF